MSDQSDRPFPQIVVCAAGVANDVGKLITAAHQRHWDVGVVATPQGLGFLAMRESTVKAHVSRVLTALEVTNRVQAALLARDAGLTT